MDDDEAIAEVLKIVLESEGYFVELDREGTFFEKPKKFLPDLVLLDMLIPGKSGQAICRVIKKQPLTAKIPVLFLSANSPQEVAKATKLAGADGYITKPFDVDKLIAEIKHYLP